jgi:hypothetical protein
VGSDKYNRNYRALYMQPLNNVEIYAVARAVAGLDWKHIQINNPLLRAMLENTTPKTGSSLLRMLGQEANQAVIAVDPNEPMPDLPKDRPAWEDVPDLPKSARLTPAQEREGRETGALLDAYLDWAGRSANQTPMLFHMWGGLFMIGTTIARRLCVNTTWQQRIYPNLYVINVALSTYYRKSAGMGLAEKIMRNTIPHLIMPNPGSPEGFITLLSGTANTDDLPQAKKAMIQRGLAFSASRAILREEISGLFKSMGSDYMRGMKEHLMQAYDAPEQLEFYNNSRGLVIVQRVGLSLFGVTTPAELSISVGTSDWYNGHLARFALITPEPDYKERPQLSEPLPSVQIEEQLRTLDRMLPTPPPVEALGGDDAPGVDAWSLVCHCWKNVDAYSQALRDMTSPTSTLDDRLRPIYGRLHVLALKVAIILAALDWAALGNTQTRPVIESRHWYRAQMIAEQARASAHRLLGELNQTQDSMVETRVASLIARHPEGVTLRYLTRSVGFSRKQIQEAIESLIEGAAIERQEFKAAKGPSTFVYKIVG